MQVMPIAVTPRVDKFDIYMKGNVAREVTDRVSDVRFSNCMDRVKGPE